MQIVVQENEWIEHLHVSKWIDKENREIFLNRSMNEIYEIFDRSTKALSEEEHYHDFELTTVLKTKFSVPILAIDTLEIPEGEEASLFYFEVRELIEIFFHNTGQFEFTENNVVEEYNSYHDFLSDFDYDYMSYAADVISDLEEIWIRNNFHFVVEKINTLTRKWSHAHHHMPVKKVW
jgi:hypothetical protein